MAAILIIVGVLIGPVVVASALADMSIKLEDKLKKTDKRKFQKAIQNLWVEKAKKDVEEYKNNLND